jgi:hypothetical protein
MLCLEKVFKKLTGNTDIEDSLVRLDKLTQEEARMASAELLKMTRRVDGKVTGVDDRVKGVEGKVQDVCDDVQDVGNKVQCVDDRIQGIGVDVKDKLGQVNRSWSLKNLFIIPDAQTASQGTSSEIVFRDGLPPQIHPLIITTHAKLITLVQLNGFIKAVYSTNGNPLDRSCGYTENVR